MTPTWPKKWPESRTDELGFVHNHPLQPDGTLRRYKSCCPGCDQREDEHP